MTANKRRFSWGAVLLVLLAMCLVYYLASGLRSQDAVSYAQVRQLFLDEKVQEFAISDTRLTAKLSDGSTVSCDLYDFQVFYDDLNDLVQEQHDQGIIRDYTYHADHGMPAADVEAVNRILMTGGDAETAEELRRRYPRLNLTTWSKENRLQF